MTVNDTVQQIQIYFTQCEQEELIAWGVLGLGVILLIMGIILFL